MKFRFLFAWILFLSFFSSSYAQHYGVKFLLTGTNYANQFSIDRIAQQIYFDYDAGYPEKVDLKTMIITQTHFLTPPVFANKRHIMLYGDTLYNLDNGTCYVISSHDSTGNTYWTFAHSFSPNDSNLTFYWTSPNYPYLSRNYVSSLGDSSLTPIDTSAIPYGGAIDNSPSQWSSDTSIVFAAGPNAIAEYFIKSRRIDTLVSTGNLPITSFAYNTERNILAYVVPDQNSSPEIFFHYMDFDKDSLILSQSGNPNDICWGGNSVGSLSWSPNGDKLGFIETYMTEPNTLTKICFYSLDSNRAYNTSPCGYYDDYSQELQWLNDDTLFYVDQTQASIYGMNVLPVIDLIEGNQHQTVPADFNIANYPNPFNNSTTIIVTLPQKTDGVLSIYDIQGKLVREYNIKNDGRTNYSVNWDGTNTSGKGVASGAYLAVLRSNNINAENRKVTKIMYLK